MSTESREAARRLALEKLAIRDADKPSRRRDTETVAVGKLCDAIEAAYEAGVAVGMKQAA